MEPERARPATQRDVAELAGVSVATVSYVVSGRHDRQSAATPEVEQRVRAAAKALGYRPQRAGRVLRRRKTDIVAVAAPSPLTPWAQEVTAEVDTVAEERSLHVVNVHWGRTTAQTDRAEQLLADGIADAAVVLEPDNFGADRLDRLASDGLPVLAIGPETLPLPPNRRWDVLVEGQSAGFRPALGHLIETTAGRIAFVAEGSVANPKVSALQQAADELGLDEKAIEVVEAPVLPATSALDIHSVIRALLSRPARERPSALVISSDRGAIAAMWTAIDLGLDIPEEVAIVGAGNIAEGRAVRPQLTTVGSDPGEYRPALEHLLDRIPDPALAPLTMAVPWRLIPRGTTRRG